MSTSRSLAKLFRGFPGFSSGCTSHGLYEGILVPYPLADTDLTEFCFLSSSVCTWPLECVLASFPDRMPRNETTLCIGFLWHAWYPVERWCHCRMSRRNRLLSHHCLQCIIALASIHSVTSRATLAYTCKQLEPLVCWVNNQSNLWFGHDSV